MMTTGEAHHPRHTLAWAGALTWMTVTGRNPPPRLILLLEIIVSVWKMFKNVDLDLSPRPVDGYRTLDSGYRAPSRQQIDPYAAQPQVMSRGMRALGSALEMRYGQGIYGLEDDQRSVGYDDYGMGPPPIHPGGYGTMPRLGPGPAGMDRRRLR